MVGSNLGEVRLPYDFVGVVFFVHLHWQVEAREHVTDRDESGTLTTQRVIPRVSAAKYFVGRGPVKKLHHFLAFAVLLGSGDN
jgi:hypothetical protein